MVCGDACFDSACGVKDGRTPPTMPSNDNVIVTLLTVLAKLQSQNVSMNSLQSSCHYLRPSISVSLSVYVDLTLKALNLVRTARKEAGTLTD